MLTLQDLAALHSWDLAIQDPWDDREPSEDDPETEDGCPECGEVLDSEWHRTRCAPGATTEAR